MPQIKYIFRDFWWTVAKINKHKDSYLSQMERMFDLPRSDFWLFLSPSMNKFRRGEISEEETRLEFFRQSKLPVKDMSRLFHTPLKKYTYLYKSIIGLVKKLQSFGYKCVILSDDYVPQVNKVRKVWRYDCFDDVLLSCEIGMSKYDDVTNGTTKIFSYVLKKYHLKPQEAIFIDDVEKNCAVAEQLGIKTVVAKGPRETIREVKKLLGI